jgi:hypothetical protein
MSTPQVGDTITTAEELDALPRRSGLVDREGNIRRAGDGAWLPATLVYLPGQPPRPEHLVKAEALREAQEAWGGNWGKEGRDVMFNALGDDLTPQGRVGKWLENRADRIERGDL